MQGHYSRYRAACKLLGLLALPYPVWLDMAQGVEWTP